MLDSSIYIYIRSDIKLDSLCKKLVSSIDILCEISLIHSSPKMI